MGYSSKLSAESIPLGVPSQHDEPSLHRIHASSESMSSTDTFASPTDMTSISNGSFLSNDLQSTPREDTFIAVMGPTGSGKSTFIQRATGLEEIGIGHGLRSCTAKVQAFRCPHPYDASRNIVFVDTPGFDDTNTKDTDILKEIAAWLETTYENNITLTGLLFFHRITDNRMAGTPLRNLSMFEGLCGLDALKNVMLITTMWSEIYPEIGSAYEKELQEKYWGPMIKAGSRLSRFDRTYESAWAIIDQFTTSIPRPVQLQQELVDEKKELGQTAAGSALYQWLDAIISRLREVLAKLKRIKTKVSANETEKVKRKLTLATQQQEKLRSDSSSSDRCRSPSPVPSMTSTRVGLGSSWSLPESRVEGHYLPLRHRWKLAATITTLRHVQQLANMSPFPPLKGAVGLCLTIAESIELMQTADQSLITLAETAGRLIIAITEASRSEEVPEETKKIVNDLTTELKGIQRLLTEKCTRRAWSRQYMLQPADMRLIASYTERINTACHIFEIRYLIDTRLALARMENRLINQSELLSRTPLIPPE